MTKRHNARAGGPGRARGKYRPDDKRTKVQAGVPTKLKERIIAAAMKAGHSESLEIENRLQRSLDFDKKIEHALGTPASRAVAVLVAKIATSVDAMTAEMLSDSWRQSADAYLALRAAIDMLLRLLAPNSSGEICWATIPGRPPRTPEEIGESIALGLWDQLRLHRKFPPEQTPTGVQLLDSFYLFPQLRIDLGLDKQEAQQ